MNKLFLLKTLTLQVIYCRFVHHIWSDIFKPIWNNFSDISDIFKYLKLQLTSQLFSPANFRNDDSQKHKVHQGDESASFFLPRSCSQPHGKKLRHGRSPFCCINGRYNWHLVKTRLGWIARDWICCMGWLERYAVKIRATFNEQIHTWPDDHPQLISHCSSTGGETLWVWDHCSPPTGWHKKSGRFADSPSPETFPRKKPDSQEG